MRKRDALNEYIDALLDSGTLDKPFQTVQLVLLAKDAFNAGWARGHMEGYREGHDEGTFEATEWT